MNFPSGQTAQPPLHVLSLTAGTMQMQPQQGGILPYPSRRTAAAGLAPGTSATPNSLASIACCATLQKGPAAAPPKLTLSFVLSLSGYQVLP